MNRRGQGLPVNMIVLVALALLVLVVVGAFFISGFGQASSSINVVNATQAQCNSICQGMVTSAFNYDSCASLTTAANTAGTQFNQYKTDCASQFGVCRVTIRGGTSCPCDAADCNP